MKDGSLLFRVHPEWAQGHFIHWAAAKQVSEWGRTLGGGC